MRERTQTYVTEYTRKRDYNRHPKNFGETSKTRRARKT